MWYKIMKEDDIPSNESLSEHKYSSILVIIRGPTPGSWSKLTIIFNMIKNETDADDSVARPYWILDIRNCLYSF